MPDALLLARTQWTVIKTTAGPTKRDSYDVWAYWRGESAIVVGGIPVVSIARRIARLHNRDLRSRAAKRRPVMGREG